MTDPIRDALREALGDLPESLQRLCAERIAAFMLALPDETPLPPGGFVYLPHVARELFAAAVERAAKEGA